MKKNSLLLFSVITVLAVSARLIGRDVIVDDMSRFLIPWYESIKHAGGFAGLSQQVGDYGLLYQTIIAFFTYLNYPPVYLYKLFSAIFDFLLALSVAYYVNHSDCNTVFRDNSFCLSYAYVVLLPTVILNSSFWGQSDSIYTFFLLLSVWFLWKEKYTRSFILLGCALSFKLQAILLFPLFLFITVLKKNFSLWHYAIIIFIFWVSGLIAYLNGRSLLDGFLIYFSQVGEYKHMWLNIPSFWALLGDNYDKYSLIAIFLTFIILATGFYLLYSLKKTIYTFDHFIGIAVFVEWTCILFLPSMHERYTYVLDILLLILAIIHKKYIKFALVAIIISCMTYNAYLFTGKDIISSYLTIIYTLAWLFFSRTLIMDNVIKR